MTSPHASTPPLTQILVLSDIHCGELAHSDRLRGKPSRNAEDDIAKAAREVWLALVRARLAPQLILVPGDLTSRGSPGEFVLTKRFITALAKEAKLGEEHVLITYGNHDVDWTVCGLGEPNSGGRAEYRRLAAKIGDIFSPGAVAAVRGPVAGSGIYNFAGVELLVLNSGIECYALDSQQDPYTEDHHGRLGTVQLEWLQKIPTPEGKVTRLAVLHHHLFNIPYPPPIHIHDISTLSEGAIVRREFGRLGIDLVIHGHRHHPHVSTQSDGNWVNPAGLLCAGSFGVNAHHRAGGGIPNTFHVVELASVTDAGNRSGRIHTFQQDTNDTWGPLSADNRNVDLDPVHWFGSAQGQSQVGSAIDAIAATGALTAKTLGACELPSFGTLSLDIRCQRQAWINEQFAAAAKKHGCRITGKYPSESPLLTPIP